MKQLLRRSQRPLVLLLMTGLSLGLVGCPKLVRTKKLKKEDMIPIYTFDESYSLKSGEAREQVYDKNYNFWKSSHDELMDDLDALIKRREAYYSYTLDYLTRMHSVLSEPLKSDFKIYVDRFKRLRSQLLATEIRYSRRVSLGSKLSYLKKDIVRDFSPRNEDVKASLHAELE